MSSRLHITRFSAAKGITHLFNRTIKVSKLQSPKGECESKQSRSQGLKNKICAEAIIIALPS
jgi:hypothetical protein